MAPGTLVIPAHDSSLALSRAHSNRTLDAAVLFSRFRHWTSEVRVCLGCDCWPHGQRPDPAVFIRTHVPNVSNVMQSPQDEVSRRSLTLSYSLFISWFYYSSYPIKTYFLWFQLCSFYYPCQDQSYGGTGIACRALEIGWCCLIPRPLFSRIYRDFRNQILAWMPWSAWWTIPCTDCHGPCRSISGCGADSSVLSWQQCSEQTDLQGLFLTVHQLWSETWHSLRHLFQGHNCSKLIWTQYKALFIFLWLIENNLLLREVTADTLNCVRVFHKREKMRQRLGRSKPLFGSKHVLNTV